jgi:hypothetical protein
LLVVRPQLRQALENVREADFPVPMKQIFRDSAIFKGEAHCFEFRGAFVTTFRKACDGNWTLLSASPRDGRSVYDRGTASSVRSMSNAFTKRNHYNPCFWTALWNEDYFSQYCSDSAQRDSPRDQVVYSLNMRAAKVIPTTVEKVHCHKGLGVAEINAESAKRFLSEMVSGKVRLHG